MLKKSTGNSINEKFYLTYSKAVIRGIILSVVLLIASGLVFYFTNLKEELLNTIIWMITILSICYSSIFGASKIGKRGYLHGAVIGACYIVVLAIVAILYGKGHLNLASYGVMLGMSIVIGAMAGMIGMLIGSNNK